LSFAGGFYRTTSAFQGFFLNKTSKNSEKKICDTQTSRLYFYLAIYDIICIGIYFRSSWPALIMFKSGNRRAITVESLQPGS